MRRDQMAFLLALHQRLPLSITCLVITLLMLILSRWFWRFCGLKKFDIAVFRRIFLIFFCFYETVFIIITFLTLGTNYGMGWRVFGSLVGGLILGGLALMSTDPNLIGSTKYTHTMETEN